MKPQMNPLSSPQKYMQDLHSPTRLYKVKEKGAFSLGLHSE